MEIREQLKLLADFLKAEITHDYIYLDIPGHFNIGDNMIYLGAMELLKSAVPYTCRYRSIVENVDYSKIGDEKKVIVLHGGGNWGDGFYTSFRNSIIEKYPRNKIIVMPQTIRYGILSDLKKDAQLYAKHSNLHLCARDIPSYELLAKYFQSNHIYLLPDTAIGLSGILPKHQGGHAEGSLLIKRKDAEISSEPWKLDGVDVKDWDSILEDLHFNRLFWPYRGLRKAKRLTHNVLLKGTCNHYYINVFEPWFLKAIPRYFNRYNKLFTTRLHGLILAKLMEMPVEWQDTRYGKISNYCQTWF